MAIRLTIHKNQFPIKYNIGTPKWMLDQIMSEEVDVCFDPKPIDFSAEGEQGSHIVLAGFPGLTIFSEILRMSFGLNGMQVYSDLQKGFDQKKVVTAHPYYNLSILPHNHNPARYYLNGSPTQITNCENKLDYSLKEIKNFVYQVIDLERSVVKSGKLIFDMTYCDREAVRYFNVLKNVARVKDYEFDIHVSSITNLEFATKIELRQYETCFFPSRGGSYNTSMTKYVKGVKNKILSQSPNYERRKKKKVLKMNLLSLGDEALSIARLSLKSEYEGKSTAEKVECIINTNKYPIEYFPLEWSLEIFESLREIKRCHLQEIYNRLTVKVHPWQCRKLKQGLKKLDFIV